jgi:hypothetical protein
MPSALSRQQKMERDWKGEKLEQICSLFNLDFRLNRQPGKKVTLMQYVRTWQWYGFYKPIFCRIGFHKWKKVKYRKRDRTLIVWEECCICRKVKEEKS